MSLFDGLIEPEAPVVAPKSTERPYLVTIKQASNGAEIMLCNVSPPPAGAVLEAKRRKLPLFTLDEIPVMRQAASADPRSIDTIIATRRTMGWGGPITYKATA